MEFKRQLKVLDNKTGMKIKSELSQIIDNHSTYKNCYFWGVNMNASQRRSREFNNTLKFRLKDQAFEVSQALDISCKNYYFSTKVYVDGCKKDIRVLKKLLT